MISIKDIDEYIKAKGISNREFQRRTGVNRATLYYARKGTHPITPKQQLKIIKYIFQEEYRKGLLMRIKMFFINWEALQVLMLLDRIAKDIEYATRHHRNRSIIEDRFNRVFVMYAKKMRRKK